MKHPGASTREKRQLHKYKSKRNEEEQKRWADREKRWMRG